MTTAAPNPIATLFQAAPDAVRQRFPTSHTIWADLVRRYGEAHREYHNLEHLTEVLEQFVEHQDQWRRPNEVYLACLFHDAIYSPLRKDNEERSAQLAATQLSSAPGASWVDPALVVSLILQTSRHGSVTGAIASDEALFLDCDMAILGAPPERYRRYSAAIAKEFGAVPSFLFRGKRARFVSRLLAADRIFMTDVYQRRLGAAAVRNLTWERDALQGE